MEEGSSGRVEGIRGKVENPVMALILHDLQICRIGLKRIVDHRGAHEILTIDISLVDNQEIEKDEQPQDKQKKAFKAIVDLLVNDTARLSAREAHQLRTNASGGSAPKTRNNGQDTCWRLSIEQNVAAARRLHYWKCGDGVNELASVTVHDVTSP